MEAADILYGITMQEPGVSTKISYTLKEALTCEERTQKSEPACAEKESELVATAANTEV
jgi:chromosome segregation ATPase